MGGRGGGHARAYAARWGFADAWRRDNAAAPRAGHARHNTDTECTARTATRGNASADRRLIPKRWPCARNGNIHVRATMGF